MRYVEGNSRATMTCLFSFCGGIVQALNGPQPSSASPVAQLLNESGLLRQASRLRVGAAGVCGIAFLTAVSGAFVAGNDAGRCYNYFPKMTEETWLPEEVRAFASPLSIDS